MNIIEINDPRIIVDDEVIGYALYINTQGICGFRLNTENLPSSVKIDDKLFEIESSKAKYYCEEVVKIINIKSKYKYIHEFISLKISEGERIFFKNLEISDIRELEK